MCTLTKVKKYQVSIEGIISRLFSLSNHVANIHKKREFTATGDLQTTFVLKNGVSLKNSQWECCKLFEPFHRAFRADPPVSFFWAGILVLCFHIMQPVHPINAVKTELSCRFLSQVFKVTIVNPQTNIHLNLCWWNIVHVRINTSLLIQLIEMLTRWVRTFHHLTIQSFYHQS